jgi:hypothetical protein
MCVRGHKSQTSALGMLMQGCVLRVAGKYGDRSRGAGRELWNALNLVFKCFVRGRHITFWWYITFIDIFT